MTVATRKAPTPGANRLGDSGPSATSPTSARTPRTAATPTATAVAGTPTPARTRSSRTGTPVSARAAAHRTTSSLSLRQTEAEEAARADAAAALEDLKSRLEKADAASEQYRKQTEVLQSRLDEALGGQAKLEERVHESEEQIEVLSNDKREFARQIREMETIYEAEKSKILKEKEEMTNKEEEMQSVINRLKETINQRNVEDENRPSRQCMFLHPSLPFPSDEIPRRVPLN
jgi:hypothetical protein